MAVNAVIALLPVLLFLAGLMLMDSFKLVRPAAVATALAWGIVAALVAQFVYISFLQRLPLSTATLSRYVAPITEELLKAVFIVYIIARRRVGFPVDTAVLGFAVGAGFATIENIQYVRTLTDASIVLWLVRGLGTAMLHGATTSIAAMLAKTAADRHPSSLGLAFVPALGAAIAIHSIFNHVLLPPVVTTALLMTALPILLVFVFERSERATGDWIHAGLDLDLELLQLITSDVFGYTRLGKYLEELKQRFPGVVVADMFCLLRVELELSVQTKAIMMMRKAGLKPEVHPDTRRALDEVAALRRSIGRTGLLALGPLHVTTHRDDWHRYLLGG